MGRRVSSGVVGGTGLGSLSVVSSTISSTVADGDITFSPNGTGEFVFESNVFLHDQADVRFGDADSSNYVAFQAPSTVASDVTWTLPSADAAVSGYALVSNAAGVLSWAAAGAALTDNNTDAADNYLVFTTLSSGFLTSARVSTGALTVQPSTGNVTITGGKYRRSTTTGVNSPSSRFGNITTTTELDFHVRTSASGASATNTQQYGMSFTNGSGETQAAIVCSENNSDGTAIGFFASSSYGSGPSLKVSIDPTGHMSPGSNNAQDLGTSSLRWRNLYTQDLHLSNGIGDYTMIEGEENLYLVNNKTNKSFKFALIEVDPSEVPPKSATD